MPLCTPEAVCDPPAGVLEVSYIRMDKIALAHSLSLVSLTCGTHMSGSFSNSHRVREREKEREREGEGEGEGACPPVSSDRRARAPVAGGQRVSSSPRRRIPPAEGRARAPPAASAAGKLQPQWSASWIFARCHSAGTRIGRGSSRRVGEDGASARRPVWGGSR
jgi:hypothetical protein